MEQIWNMEYFGKNLPGFDFENLSIIDFWLAQFRELVNTKPIKSVNNSSYFHWILLIDSLKKYNSQAGNLNWQGKEKM